MINWKSAPTWAKFAAMDADGSWWWYEKEPTAGEVGWYNFGGGRCAAMSMPEPYWRDSLTKEYE